MRLSSSYLRWCLSCILEKTGKKALLVLLFPAVLIGYQQIYMLPDITQLHEDNAILRQQLTKPLPVFANGGAQLQHTLNETEYQQVKSLFDIFQQNHLQVDGSHYQFSTDQKTRQRKLILDIPLRGGWADLTHSLSQMNRTLVYTLDRLSTKRANPESGRVQINLQLTIDLTSHLEPS